MWRWPPARATALLFVGGTLFLPEQAERVTVIISGIPAFNKQMLITLWVLVGALWFHRSRFSSASFPSAFKWCIGFLLVGAVFTALGNTDPLTYGSKFIPGHRTYDIVHFVIKRTLLYVVPFALGVTMFRNSSDLRTLFETLVQVGLVYSVLQVGEMLVSPQFHRWVYGYHQHSFAQTMRSGGFRPMVFMGHGLALAMFTVLVTIAAAALQKTGVKVFNIPSRVSTGYLVALLALSRSVAALLYGIAIVPIVLFLSPKRQATVALLIAGLLMVYPLARGLGMVPVERISEIAFDQWGVDKAGSLTVRFENEVLLLERARERFWFGWGTYCRACIFEPWTGDLVSIRDGAWVLALGDGGLAGFLGQFGLLVFPVVAVFRRLRRVSREADRRLLAALSLMVGVSAFDLIPNGAFNSVPTLFAGALAGTLPGIVLESARARQRRRAERLQRAQAAREVLAT